jgi:hypothetical protein
MSFDLFRFAMVQRGDLLRAPALSFQDFVAILLATQRANKAETILPHTLPW